jgi:hypothetical protein
MVLNRGLSISCKRSLTTHASDGETPWETMALSSGQNTQQRPSPTQQSLNGRDPVGKQVCLLYSSRNLTKTLYGATFRSHEPTASRRKWEAMGFHVFSNTLGEPLFPPKKM